MKTRKSDSNNADQCSRTADEPVAALAARSVVEVHVVVADEVEDHLGGLGQRHGAQVDTVHHVLQRSLTQPAPGFSILIRFLRQFKMNMDPDLGFTFMQE